MSPACCVARCWDVASPAGCQRRSRTHPPPPPRVNPSTPRCDMCHRGAVPRLCDARRPVTHKYTDKKNQALAGSGNPFPPGITALPGLVAGIVWLCALSWGPRGRPALSQPTVAAERRHREYYIVYINKYYITNSNKWYSHRLFASVCSLPSPAACERLRCAAEAGPILREVRRGLCPCD